MFVLPAVFLGFLLSVPILWVISVMMFPDGNGSSTSMFPSFYSCLTALFVGIFVPIFSSIIPIRRALSKNLTDGLSTERA